MDNAILYEVIRQTKRWIMETTTEEKLSFDTLPPKLVITTLKRFIAEVLNDLQNLVLEDHALFIKRMNELENPVLMGLMSTVFTKSAQQYQDLTPKKLTRVLTELQVIFTKENFYKEQRVYLEICQNARPNSAPLGWRST